MAIGLKDGLPLSPSDPSSNTLHARTAVLCVGIKSFFIPLPILSHVNSMFGLVRCTVLTSVSQSLLAVIPIALTGCLRLGYSMRFIIFAHVRAFLLFVSCHNNSHSTIFMARKLKRWIESQ